MMGDNAKPHSSKYKRSRKDSDRKTRKRYKHEDREDSRKPKHKENDHQKLRITDDDPDDEDMWVEKNIDMDGEKVSFLLFIFRLSDFPENRSCFTCSM
jgi:hypothetical protein